MTELPNIATESCRSRQLAVRNERKRDALPLVLLLLATLFLLGGDREYFYRGGINDWNSSQTLAFAENLSFRHNLLIFHIGVPIVAYTLALLCWRRVFRVGVGSV